MFGRILQYMQKSYHEAPEGSVSTLLAAGTMIGIALEGGVGALAVVVLCSAFGLVMGISFGTMAGLAFIVGGALALLITTQSLPVIFIVLGMVMILMGVTGATDIFHKKSIRKEETPAP